MVYAKGANFALPRRRPVPKTAHLAFHDSPARVTVDSYGKKLTGSVFDVPNEEHNRASWKDFDLWEAPQLLCYPRS